MTKYKTNAEKLKFFNDAKAARLPKAAKGMGIAPMRPDLKNPNPPIGPDARVRNGVVDNWGDSWSPPSGVPGRKPSMYTPEQVAEFTEILNRIQNRPMKKGGSVKRKKRK